MKPKLASIVLCVLTLVASVYGMTLNDELLSAFMAMNHHAHIVEGLFQLFQLDNSSLLFLLSNSIHHSCLHIIC
jgi:hypothetical protein